MVDTEPQIWYLRILERQGFAIVFGIWALYIGTSFLTAFTSRVDSQHQAFELQLVQLRADQQQTSKAIIDVLNELKNEQSPAVSTLPAAGGSNG